MSRCSVDAGAAADAVLLVRAQSWYCALPVADVVETCRPLPVQPVDGVPIFVRGVSVIRAVTAPVIHLGRLLAGGEAEPGRRFVTVQVRGRPVLLEVDEVLGVRRLSRARLASAAPLVGGALAERIAALGVLDGELLAWLEVARWVTDELLDLVLAEGWG